MPKINPIPVIIKSGNIRYSGKTSRPSAVIPIIIDTTIDDNPTSLLFNKSIIFV
jgi:hypothetical protein